MSVVISYSTININNRPMLWWVTLLIKGAVVRSSRWTLWRLAFVSHTDGHCVSPKAWSKQYLLKIVEETQSSAIKVRPHRNRASALMAASVVCNIHR